MAGIQQLQRAQVESYHGGLLKYGGDFIGRNTNDLVQLQPYLRFAARKKSTVCTAPHMKHENRKRRRDTYDSRIEPKMYVKRRLLDIYCELGPLA